MTLYSVLHYGKTIKLGQMINSKISDMNSLSSTIRKYHVFYTKEILNVT